MNEFHTRREVGSETFDYWRQQADKRSRSLGGVADPGDGKPRIEDPWAASVRSYNATNAQSLLEQRLLHAQAMRRSHERTFTALVKKWELEAEKLEAQLGKGRHNRKAS